MAKKKQIIVFAILVFTLFGCANQLPPSGGEIDRIPPKIIECYPKSGTTNFSDDHISFTFSEYVDKRSAKDAIFISPKIEGEIEYDWSGTTLEISFPKYSLLPKTTYSVTVGTDVKDINHGNNMAKAFTLCFSTGDKIDNGTIKGKVYADKPQGVLIFAYKESSGRTNPLKYKPNYISQTGKDGSFSIGGLAEDDYKIFAIEDKFRDLLYNIGEDDYGVPFKNISITAEDSLITDVNFFLTRQDTVAPQMQDVTMTDNHHIRLKFSEPIDSSKLTSKNFFIFDSTSQNKFSIDYWFAKRNKPLEYFLAFKDTLNSTHENYLVLENLFDKAGNKITHEEIPLAVNEKPDTVAPQVTTLFTKYENKLNPFDPSVFISLNDATDTNKAKKGISVFDKDSTEQKVYLTFFNSATVKIDFEKVKSNAQYVIAFNLKYFKDVAGNFSDTVITKTVVSLNKLDFSGAEGTVKTNSKNPVVVTLEKTDDKNISYSETLVQKLNFNFKSVIPGKYILWVFEDRNKNGKYDYGKVFPFSLSEKFKFLKDTLNLRARWPVGGITVDFD